MDEILLLFAGIAPFVAVVAIIAVLRGRRKLEQCDSIAPWPDEDGNVVRCQVPAKEKHVYHGGNGWSWEEKQ